MKESKAASSKGESHRIYWQQWPSSAGGPVAALTSRRDLITSSAAIRMSPEGARAQDVTNLLCETLSLKTPEKDAPAPESWDKVQDAWEQDSLVLVGTLYSLPLHYVNFEHERIEAQQQLQQKKSVAGGDGASMKETSSHSSSSGGTGTAKTPKINRSDPPFHVIKTLSSADNPIQVRDAMIQHLEHILEQSASAAAASNSNNQSGVTHSIAPKLQWYFVPGVNHPSSPIPSYIDLDGYSTSMEEEESEDGDHSETGPDAAASHTAEDTNDTSEHDFDPDILESFSLSLQEQNQVDEKSAMETSDNRATTASTKSTYPEERIIQKERERFFELSMCQSTLQHDCISGYLLKQSMKDPHVWKRVYCVLSDDHLWFVSRVYTKHRSTIDQKNAEENDTDQEETNQQQQLKHGFYNLARHCRLGLTRALLLQPSSDRPTAPLYRTPFAFEVIASDGLPHRFRAPSPALYKKWTEALSSRIVQSYENSLFEHADLIVRDETEARNRRFMSLAVDPLWENQKNNLENNQLQNDNHRHVAMDTPTMNILRFGIEVSEYRERCRHIQAILPAKHPVLALSDSNSTVRQSDENGQSNGEGPSLPTHIPIRLDLPTQSMIKSAWDEAIRLGSSATKLAMSLQADKGEKAKMPRSLETICQHLEYVITGNFRRPSSTGSSSKAAPTSKQHPAGRNTMNDSTRQYPPPFDLFDVLLSELQTVAASVTKQKLSVPHATANSTLGESASMNGGH